MNASTLINRFLSIIFRVIAFPLLLLILIFDLNIGRRLISNRYGIKDIFPHLIPILIPVIVYCLYKMGYLIMSTSNLKEVLSTIINLQGIIFATSIAVSTFILSIFKQAEIKLKHPDKKELIDDIIDDLRIANRINFVSTLCIFSVFILSLFLFGHC